MTRPVPPNRKRRSLMLGVGSLAALPALPAFAAPDEHAPRPANLLWYRQSAARWEEALPLGNGKGKLGFELAWRAPRKVKYAASNDPGLATNLAAAAPTDWLQREEAAVLPAEAGVEPDGAGALLITGRNEAMHGIPAGLRFALRVQVIGDGRLAYADGRLSLLGASEATLLIGAATSYVNYRDVSADPVAIVRSQQARAAAKPYSALKRDHVREHARLFASMSIDLGSQVNVRDTPDLVRAARTSLTRRGDFATGWGTAWRLCLWARMGDAEHAYSVLKGLTGPMRTYPNMFDAHPPFQIDGNFGGAAGIMEMLPQSWGGEVLLLPALPSAWPTGSLKGIRARGGMSLDLDWRAGRLTRLGIKGKPGTRVRLRYQGKLSVVALDRDGVFAGTGALPGSTA